MKLKRCHWPWQRPAISRQSHSLTLKRGGGGAKEKKENKRMHADGATRLIEILGRATEECASNQALGTPIGGKICACKRCSLSIKRVHTQAPRKQAEQGEGVPYMLGKE